MKDTIVVIYTIQFTLPNPQVYTLKLEVLYLILEIFHLSIVI